VSQLDPHFKGVVKTLEEGLFSLANPPLIDPLGLELAQLTSST
jgi:hypothetical protein